MICCIWLQHTDIGADGRAPWPCRAALNMATFMPADVYQSCDHLCNHQQASGPTGDRGRSL